jgi:uncharacterized protein YecT (DUF1311 family)
MNAKALLTLLLCAFTPVTAQEPEEGCTGTTSDESVCLSRKYKKIEAELNESYLSALKSGAHYGEPNIQNLKDAQRKWIAYRDAECDAEYNLWGGGSGGPNARTICLIKLMRERVTRLKAAYRSFSK